MIKSLIKNVFPANDLMFSKASLSVVGTSSMIVGTDCDSQGMLFKFNNLVPSLLCPQFLITFAFVLL